MAGQKGRKGKPSFKAYYAAYKASGRAEKNRKLRLERHLETHPNDEQTAKALAKPLKYRKKPQGGKTHTRALGIQEVSPNVFTYVGEVFANGHPVNELAKNKFVFDMSRKLKYSAKFTPEFSKAYVG